MYDMLYLRAVYIAVRWALGAWHCMEAKKRTELLSNLSELISYDSHCRLRFNLYLVAIAIFHLTIESIKLD